MHNTRILSIPGYEKSINFNKFKYFIFIFIYYIYVYLIILKIYIRIVYHISFVYKKIRLLKTCAYNNRFALKCTFGESYNDLYPGTIYSPPSYDVRFSSTATSSWYHLFTFIGFLYYGNINTLVWDRLFQLLYSFEE